MLRAGRGATAVLSRRMAGAGSLRLVPERIGPKSYIRLSENAGKRSSNYVTRQFQRIFGRVKKGGVRTYAGTAALRDYQNPPGAQSQAKWGRFFKKHLVKMVLVPARNWIAGNASSTIQP